MKEGNNKLSWGSLPQDREVKWPVIYLAMYQEGSIRESFPKIWVRLWYSLAYLDYVEMCEITKIPRQSCPSSLQSHKYNKKSTYKIVILLAIILSLEIWQAFTINCCRDTQQPTENCRVFLYRKCYLPSKSLNSSWDK